MLRREPGFGAINIEDIESPKVFDIIKRLQNELSIPVFHDDQHGTSVITLAALINFLKLLSKKIDSIKVIISGRLCWLRYFQDSAKGWMQGYYCK